MSGRWRIDPVEVLAHDHVLIETAEHRLALNDPRRFGSLDLVASDAIDSYPPFAAMGPEPLGPDFTAATLHAALAGRSEEHTSELQSLMRISYAVFCLKKKK